jgi:hypothetical protein
LPVNVATRRAVLRFFENLFFIFVIVNNIPYNKLEVEKMYINPIAQFPSWPIDQLRLRIKIRKIVGQLLLVTQLAGYRFAS